MKVFLSWSGELSQSVALALSRWLPDVVQAVAPFVSSEDIAKGSRWGTTLAQELEATAVGVFCVTRGNLGSAWLNFEAGAISSSLDNSRVMPFLFGLKKSEVSGPLTQFQMTAYDRDDVGKLVAAINGSCSPPCIDEGTLSRAFARCWPDLEKSLAPLVTEAERLTAETPARDRVDQGAILEELLELARRQQRATSDLGALRNAFVHGVGRGTSEQALDDLRSRWAAVALTARGLTDANGRSYRALFEYLEPGVTRLLQEADLDRRVPPEEGDAVGAPAYRVVSRPIGNDIVALRDFGGGHGDPVAAWVKVDGRVVLQVLAPQVRAVWGADTEERFREAVRRLAATHGLLGRTGEASVLFDPPQEGVDDGTSPPGEPIRRG